ncbi:hypothetical protein JOB18_018578, partial [Solea senegalensis]
CSKRRVFVKRRRNLVGDNLALSEVSSLKDAAQGTLSRDTSLHSERGPAHG